MEKEEKMMNDAGYDTIASGYYDITPALKYRFVRFKKEDENPYEIRSNGVAYTMFEILEGYHDVVIHSGNETLFIQRLERWLRDGRSND